MTADIRYDINCSMLFTDLPLLARPAAAKAAGFDGIEYWWPFNRSVPSDRDITDFVDCIAEAQVQLVSLNLFGGNLRAGDRGIASWPGRDAEFSDNLEVAVEIGRRLSCGVFNVLYGNRIDGYRAADQDDLAVVHLVRAARAASTIGALVVVEPLSGVAGYPLKTAANVLDILETVDEPNAALLADLYHLSVNGEDIAALFREYAGKVGHVQIADAPGRGRPGTGDIPFRAHLAQLTSQGYTGWVGLEYDPGGPTSESLLAWRAGI